MQSKINYRLRTVAFASLMVIASVTDGWAASCKSYATCREAVIAWCAGQHSGADRDGDGIPCENVCRSRADVERVLQEIGCDR